MVFLDTLWPDFDRRHLWQAIQTYAERDRRYGGAVDRAAEAAAAATVPVPSEPALEDTGL